MANFPYICRVSWTIVVFIQTNIHSKAASIMPKFQNFQSGVKWKVRPSLEVFHFDWSDRNLLFQVLTNWVIAPALPFSTFHYCREFGNRTKNGKSHSSWLARFDQKMSFCFPRTDPLVSDRLVWDNRKRIP